MGCHKFLYRGQHKTNLILVRVGQVHDYNALLPAFGAVETSVDAKVSENIPSLSSGLNWGWWEVDRLTYLHEYKIRPLPIIPTSALI